MVIADTIPIDSLRKWYSASDIRVLHARCGALSQRHENQASFDPASSESRHFAPVFVATDQPRYKKLPHLMRAIAAPAAFPRHMAAKRGLNPNSL